MIYLEITENGISMNSTNKLIKWKKRDASTFLTLRERSTELTVFWN